MDSTIHTLAGITHALIPAGAARRLGGGSHPAKPGGIASSINLRQARIPALGRFMRDDCRLAGLAGFQLAPADQLIGFAAADTISRTKLGNAVTAPFRRWRVLIGVWHVQDLLERRRTYANRARLIGGRIAEDPPGTTVKMGGRALDGRGTG